MNAVSVSRVEEAFPLIETFAPHALLVDYMMPVMNGVEFISKVRESHQEIGIVGYTAVKAHDVEMAFTSAGADFVLYKVARKEDLASALVLAAHRRWGYRGLAGLSAYLPCAILDYSRNLIWVSDALRESGKDISAIKTCRDLIPFCQGRGKCSKFSVHIERERGFFCLPAGPCRFVCAVDNNRSFSNIVHFSDLCDSHASPIAVFSDSESDGSFPLLAFNKSWEDKFSSMYLHDKVLSDTVHSCVSKASTNGSYNGEISVSGRMFAVCCSKHGDKIFFLSSDVTELSDCRADSQNRAILDGIQSFQRLVCGLSHEIQTPMATIRGYASSTVEELVEDRELLEETLRGIKDAADQMTGILVNVAGYSGPFDDNPVTDLYTTVPTVVRALQYVEPLSRMDMDMVHVDVDSFIDLSVRMPVSRFKQALGNVLTNAAKACLIRRDHGAIFVDGGVSKSDSAYVEVRVRDTGIGMSDEVKAHHMEPRYTRFTKFKGEGLGMSIVYDYVDRAGGRVKVESQLGVGTTICLCLQRA